MQTYQTMHPINEQEVQNQYRRFPQLLLSADYPDQAFGLEYFLQTEATHFDIRNTPGTLANQPVGNRFHLQPGVSLPLFWPYFYINPRAQLSITGYNLTQTFETQTPNSAKRTIPIFDMAIGAAFNRKITLFNHYFEQTLEPQVYYTYIPYRNQASIPKFDTTVNTLTYDQIFNYNRFSSIDRMVTPTSLVSVSPRASLMVKPAWKKFVSVLAILFIFPIVALHFVIMFPARIIRLIRPITGASHPFPVYCFTM